MYCLESRRLETEFTSDNLIFIIHPELYGSSFTISGLDSNSELNSIISYLSLKIGCVENFWYSSSNPLTKAFFSKICISFFVSNNNETLKLSKNINKFKLITHSNEKFDDKLFSNYPALIFFGFLNCPDVCPFTLTKISEIIHKLKDKSQFMRFYFVTVDPERDKIQDLKEYLKAFHPNHPYLLQSENK